MFPFPQEAAWHLIKNQNKLSVQLCLGYTDLDMKDSEWGWEMLCKSQGALGPLGSTGRLGPGLDQGVRNLAWGLLRSQGAEEQMWVGPRNLHFQPAPRGLGCRAVPL